MPARDLDAFATQQPCQHSRPCKWMLEVKLVNPAHQFQIRFADSTRLVIGARPADAYQPGLLCHRQGVITIDHRLTPSSPALLSALSKKQRSRHSTAPWIETLSVGFVLSSSGSLLPAIMTDSRPSFSTQRTVRILEATSMDVDESTSIAR
ncbi:hypothetical protein P3T21_006032 [Paraburkholderia sp. GAS334]